MKKFRAVFALLAIVVACGGAQKVVETAPPPPPPRDAIADVNMRTLVLEMAERKACSQLEGKWLGLPAQDDTGSSCPKNLTGADAGLGCAWGRLQIRDCKAAITDGALSLSFGGVGWTWVERKVGDIGIRQYVYLTASVDMRGAFDVGYDPATKIASVWLTPTEPLKARVQALGTIKLNADSFAGELEKVAASALGVDPKHQFAMQGAQMFEEKLRKGMTITFDTQSQQVDLMLSPLPNGVVPKRPFEASETTTTWILNERQELFPGGVQFSGPYDPASLVKLEGKWESGAPASYGMVCATDATSVADALARSERPSLALLNRGQFTDPAFSKLLAPPPCPWVLVTSTAGNDSSRFALRITPATASEGGGAPVVVVPSRATVWVTVMSFEFETRKPDGKSWDFGGGAPDPQIWMQPAASGTRIVIVPMMKDTFKASPMLRAQVAVEVSRSSPLTIGATDVDVGEDDPMGQAVIFLDDVINHPSLEVETRIRGTRTGTIRLRLERAQ